MSNFTPTDIAWNKVVNIASTILEHQASRLEGTFVGRALKLAGLIQPDFYDRLQSLLRTAVKRFFDENVLYRRQSIVDFLQDRIVSQQISNHILERTAIDDVLLLKKLKEYLHSEPEAEILLRSRQLNERKIIQDFFDAYKHVRNEYLTPALRAKHGNKLLLS